MFDGFFDCACAMTRADILVNPLSADDKQQNENIINSWQADEAARPESRRARNHAYRRRVDAERSALAEELGLEDRQTIRRSFLHPADDN